MESLENPSGFGFLPLIIYQGLGDLPVLSRRRLLTEQRAILADVELCKFLSLEDWKATFYGESWPRLDLDPGVYWPRMEEQVEQEGQGKHLISLSHTANV